MKVILCEKPSVAKNFADVLGGKKSPQGYYQTQQYYITWALGHLLVIDEEKSNIDNQKWAWETLPVFPEKFMYRPKDSNASKQLKLIKELLNKADGVIIACDPGREGELIARLILQYCGWKKWDNTYRFWTSEALTASVIKKTLNNLRPAKDFDSLYWSANARQAGDFLVGINLTRACTLKARNGLWSVGRVQTPTLYALYMRDKEILDFKPVPYGVVIGELEGNIKTQLHIEPETSLSYQNAKKIVAELLTSGDKAIVMQITSKQHIEKPPLLHSLTSLQKEANQLYKLTAQETLDIAQDLYENNLISYPRTDSQYLAQSSKELVKEILSKLSKQDLIAKMPAREYIFDDSKLTDHYAIIPFDVFKHLQGFSKNHELIYQLIVRKFIGTFYDDYIYNTAQVLFNIGKYKFISRGKNVIQEGWHILYPEGKSEDIVFHLEPNQVLEVLSLKAEERRTTPPPRYKESDILKVMEKYGLGTPATRANIIETLKSRQYCSVDKGKLSATLKAQELIKHLVNTPLISPEVTATWEKELDAIYTQRRSMAGYADFVNKIKKFVVDNLAIIKGAEFASISDNKSLLAHKDKKKYNTKQ